MAQFCAAATGPPGRLAWSIIPPPLTDTTEALRSFDTGGGGDERPTHIAMVIEHFARAAALGQAGEHVEHLAFRTGLSRAEVGRTLTMMVRAGVELFVHFRALWSHAREQYNDRQ